MKGFVLTGEGTVLTEWIDRNRHMNMARYLGLFDDACDALLGRSGLVVEGNDLTFVAGRVQMAHRRELFEGDGWQIWSGFASVTERGVTFAHRLASEGAVRATCDIYSTPFCLGERTSMRLDGDQMERAASFVIAGLADPFAVASPARPAS